ncbi:hypothetical protein HO498_06020 [Streptococcus suis]|nr:hypothetical protein [Streptococcus suis]
MSVNQVILEIPLDIQMGLSSGIYKRYGSVIRDASGHIVKHLKEVKVSEPAQQIAKNLTKNKYVLVGAIGAGVVTVGSVGYYIWASKKYKRVVKKLLEKLVRFIKLAHEGELTEDYVDEFMKFLQANQKELLVLKLDSTVDELFELVYNYTVNFAKANDFDISTISKVSENNKVINLMEYLNLQKNIYESSVA